ncbi:hypothetical protein ONS95_002143 [Cadophora gregata]|uniref:uncharacterized protein n=1 Tax=Cadophora gregata TaxID=51156 RepID=UPI0026DD4DBA|nr:uncharacterized protein ONS95_002143 [Cadophora gregata]KAK0109450.1 hypothetical protein ONS95_002143 [Cadophora gregata]KAK0110921.1 hypothetical protein ONS96_002507 [Cadophora gregata f. sp. sojae]
MAESTLVLPYEPAPLTEFHCLNNLPIEIRQSIWYHCLPGPRIHRICWTDPNKSSRSSCISPTVMFVCQESRRESLHHLKKLSLPSIFSSGTKSTPEGCISRCYFNPRLDTLFLTSPAHPSMRFSPWLQPWLNGLNDTDFSIVESIAIDRTWLEPFPPVTGPVLQLGELVRRLGNVQVVHVVSLNSYWSMQPWTMWKEIGLVPGNLRAEFFWVDMEEVKKRPAGGYTCIWADWGENSQMTRAGIDVLSLDGEDANARLKDVMRRLEVEREKYPTGWSMPRLQLDFVRYDRVKREDRPLTVVKSSSTGGSTLNAVLAVLPSLPSINKWVGRG